MNEQLEISRMLIEMLNIPSPTFKEQEKNKWIQDWLKNRITGVEFVEHDDSFIVTVPKKSTGPHVTLVGHTDTVPEFFPVRQEEARIHGSGASDMQCSLPCYMKLLQEYASSNDAPYHLSMVIYAREENTPLKANGLYTLIEKERAFFDSVDVAIVGEPTNGAIQIGCVGSIHATVVVKGQAAHSARPWNGENALYKAHDFIGYFKSLARIKHTVFGVDFFDVMSITTSESVTPTRTTIPGAWRCNVNYRFAPVQSLEEAEEKLLATFEDAGVSRSDCVIEDSVYAGKVVENDALKQIVSALNLRLEAKQAWTDVAQLGEIGVAAFNFGAGLTEQAHKDDEYVVESDVLEHYTQLRDLLILGKDE